MGVGTGGGSGKGDVGRLERGAATKKHPSGSGSGQGSSML